MSEHFISREDAESGLLACAAYAAESIASSDGHAEAMSAVVPRYLAKGDVDLAAELANTVDDPFTRNKLLILVAEKCAGSDDDEYAIQLVDAIEDFGLQAEGRERIALIKARRGQFETAREIAGAIPHPGFVEAAIAEKQAADGNFAAAEETIAAIDFASARVSAFVGIAHAELSGDRYEQAVDFLEKALESASGIEHDEEKIRVFCEIGNLFTEAKRNDRAIETFDMARGFAEQLDNMHRDAFLAVVSVGFLRAGSQDLADRSLDLVADKTQIATCLLGHARHFWQSEQNDEAIESLEEAQAILKSQREIETRNSKERIGLFKTIAAQFAGFEKGERAIEIAEAIDDENESMAALSQIAAILAFRQDDDLARQSLNAIPEDAQRTFALIGMADAKATNAEKDAVATLLDEAAHLAESVPQLASRASAFIQIAQRAANLETARIFDDSVSNTLKTIESIKNESTQVTSLVELSELLEGQGIEIPDGGREQLISILGRAK